MAEVGRGQEGWGGGGGRRSDSISILKSGWRGDLVGPTAGRSSVEAPHLNRQNATPRVSGNNNSNNNNNNNFRCVRRLVPGVRRLSFRISQKKNKKQNKQTKPVRPAGVDQRVVSTRFFCFSFRSTISFFLVFFWVCTSSGWTESMGFRGGGSENGPRGIDGRSSPNRRPIVIDRVLDKRQHVDDDGGRGIGSIGGSWGRPSGHNGELTCSSTVGRPAVRKISRPKACLASSRCFPPSAGLWRVREREKKTGGSLSRPAMRQKFHLDHLPPRGNLETL